MNYVLLTVILINLVLDVLVLRLVHERLRRLESRAQSQRTLNDGLYDAIQALWRLAQVSTTAQQQDHAVLRSFLHSLGVTDPAPVVTKH